jgi:hypothetical protein
MKALSKRNLFIITVLLLAVLSLKEVCGFPSGRVYPPTFTQGADGYYDSWGFNRNRWYDEKGYMPNIAYETLNGTLGNNAEHAYSIGEQLKTSYPDRAQRAEAVLKYVQKWTDYGHDSDYVIRDGVPQNEWAWNADEMAHAFNPTMGTVAIGDCEDMAFLCATIYIGAGFDATMIIAPGHCAMLIWFPEYSHATNYWDINDGRGHGWIWVEATGENNPLGWTPDQFRDGKWNAYPLAVGGGAPETPRFPWELIIILGVVIGIVSVSLVVVKKVTSKPKVSLPPPPPPPPPMT